MANTQSAKKRIRQASVRRDRNRSARSRMRNAIRNLRAHAEAGEHEAARAALGPTLSLIDRSASKGVIHRNTAARYKSRLVHLVGPAAPAAPAVAEEQQAEEPQAEGSEDQSG